MGKKTTLILSAFFVSALLHAQQTDTLAVLQQRAQNENADFSFTESQLNEDDDAARPFRPSQESATTCTCLKWAIYSVPCASA